MVNQWILTKFKSVKTKKFQYFIAFVLRNSPEIYVKFVKHVRGTLNIFTDNNPAKYLYIDKDAILKMLPEPEMDRKCR